MDIEENKLNAIAFYRTAYEGNPAEAIEKYVGEKYIQQIPQKSDNTNTMY